MRVLPLHTIPWHCTSAATAGLCGLVDLFVPPALPHIHKLCVVAAVPLFHLFKAKAGTILHSGSVQPSNLSLLSCNGLTTDGPVGGSGVHLYDRVVCWPAIEP